MCSRISSLDYTCNLRRAAALSILVLFALAGLLSFRSVCWCFPFRFTFHDSCHCQYPWPLAILSGNDQASPVQSSPVLSCISWNVNKNSPPETKWTPTAAYKLVTDSINEWAQINGTSAPDSHKKYILDRNCLKVSCPVITSRRGKTFICWEIKFIKILNHFSPSLRYKFAALWLHREKKE